MKKTRYNQFINRYYNFNKSLRNTLKNTYIYDEEKHIFLLCNGYSIVRINFNFQNRTLFKRYHELDINKCDDNVKNQVINFFHNFEEEQFCNNVEEEKITDKYLHIKNSDITFDTTMIKNIVNLISKNNDYSMFESEINKNAICITGNYGYAYLLGCRNY